jgi:hypothetical protein
MRRGPFFQSVVSASGGTERPAATGGEGEFYSDGENSETRVMSLLPEMPLGEHDPRLNTLRDRIGGAEPRPARKPPFSSPGKPPGYDPRDIVIAS